MLRSGKSQEFRIVIIPQSIILKLLKGGKTRPSQSDISTHYHLLAGSVSRIDYSLCKGTLSQIDFCICRSEYRAGDFQAKYISEPQEVVLYSRHWVIIYY
ncbi:hypothetical protein AVEN_54113-1 [Araneus ventricosus]|uniref:Uncharacterized protein n=1 Tax=Araneus ventricosus TaxID=182803 RepID=A0A4Y2BTW2_ARAVE|nr:hypothetical protein AVEN_54113-1 [Araneus ventricosus]